MSCSAGQRRQQGHGVQTLAQQSCSRPIMAVVASKLLLIVDNSDAGYVQARRSNSKH
jgi:hypothetical protein